MSGPAILLSHGETARTWWYGAEALALLRGLGPVALNTTDAPLDGKALVEAAHGCRVIVMDRTTRIGAAEFAALPELVAVVRSGVEVRRIDIEAATAAGVLVTRSNPGYVASTAELVLTHMLNAARDIPAYVSAYRAGRLRAPSHGREMSGATSGLIGYGRIARHLAHILNAMGMTVIAYDPFTSVDAPATQVTLEELFARSDFVVPLVVASEATRNLIDAAAFAQMKRDAWLVNVSRGDVVDEDALRAALDQKRIAGAAMDVGWGEDHLPTPDLARRDDVQATPHIGNLTKEAAARHPIDTVAQSAEILAGRIPFGAVNPQDARRLMAFGTQFPENRKV